MQPISSYIFQELIINSKNACLSFNQAWVTHTVAAQRPLHVHIPYEGTYNQKAIRNWYSHTVKKLVTVYHDPCESGFIPGKVIPVTGFLIGTQFPCNYTPIAPGTT